MATVRRSQLAEQDLRDIWQYIATDNPDAADRLLNTIDSKLERYAGQPAMGAPRDSLAPGLRSFPIGRYLVFYRIAPDGIEVARILHGARDLGRLFRNPS
jgi:toxin ParE1/3/4